MAHAMGGGRDQLWAPCPLRLRLYFGTQFAYTLAARKRLGGRKGAARETSRELRTRCPCNRQGLTASGEKKSKIKCGIVPFPLDLAISFTEEGDVGQSKRSHSEPTTRKSPSPRRLSFAAEFCEGPLFLKKRCRTPCRPTPRSIHRSARSPPRFRA